MNRLLIQAGTKRSDGSFYLTYRSDLSLVKFMVSYYPYSGKGDERLEFLIRHGKLYMRKHKDNKIVRRETVKFNGFIPMSFSIKCKTYCSDCGICAW